MQLKTALFGKGRTNLFVRLSSPVRVELAAGEFDAGLLALAHCPSGCRAAMRPWPRSVSS